MQISTIAATPGRVQNFGMSEPSTTPATLQDDELQNLASEWRIRAMQGDQLAHRMAQALEAEQRRRIRDTGLQTAAARGRRAQHGALVEVLVNRSTRPDATHDDHRLRYRPRAVQPLWRDLSFQPAGAPARQGSQSSIRSRARRGSFCCCERATPVPLCPTLGARALGTSRIAAAQLAAASVPSLRRRATPRRAAPFRATTFNGELYYPDPAADRRRRHDCCVLTERF